MINEALEIQIEVDTKSISNKIRVPGLLDSHYSPAAKVYLTGIPEPGDGLIALIEFPTPPGVVRLISPKNNEEYARSLYKGLRIADTKKIDRVFVIPPFGDDISVAVRDRLIKAANNDSKAL